MNAVYVLLFVAVASPLLALFSTGQDPAAVDWAKEVERACTSPRYGLRLAASRKVAQAGAPAVPAIRAFAAANGLNEVPDTLVSLLADEAPHDAPVIELLRDWALTKDFYWRSTAMRGLATRAPKLPEATRAELGKLFTDHYADLAWLTRVYAQLGGTLLGDPAALQRPEPDPRARAKLAMLLLQHTDQRRLQDLLDALADERTFQGDPWGQRMAGEVHKVLKAWLADAHPLAASGGAFEDTETGLRQLTEACAKKAGTELAVPALRRDPETQFAGGFELLSCQWGDTFVQWTATGEIHVGLDCARLVALPAEVWRTLDAERRALDLPATMGNVVCDNLRLRWQEPAVHVKVAPGSLTPAAAAWLADLARALEQAGAADMGKSLRVSLAQFAPR